MNAAHATRARRRRVARAGETAAARPSRRSANGTKTTCRASGCSIPGPRAVGHGDDRAVPALGRARPRRLSIVARELLARFGSLRACSTRSAAELRGMRGIGPAQEAQLLAVVEMAGARSRRKMRERSLMNSPDAVEDYLRLLIGTRPYEVFVSLFLDARHQLLLRRNRRAARSRAWRCIRARSCGAR